jgi:hypothetical protein
MPGWFYSGDDGARTRPYLGLRRGLAVDMALAAVAERSAAQPQTFR